MKTHAAIEPSMLQDLKKGKPCEIEAINGVVCGHGRKAGVPTPVNDRIVEIIRAVQDGSLQTGRQNLARF
jgi:2-dehydropantoate 2-reductase